MAGDQVICENMDGSFKVKLDSGGNKIDVDRSSIRPIHVQQVRLPSAIVDKIKATPKESMQTSTRFYVLNKGSPENPKPAILDQTCLIVALKTVEPTMPLNICYAITINILVHYGYNADLNGDGVVSPDEWYLFIPCYPYFVTHGLLLLGVGLLLRNWRRQRQITRLKTSTCCTPTTKAG